MAQQQPYRVTGDWPGGGFAYTLPFSSTADALAWGNAKAEHHPDAVVTAVPRFDSKIEASDRRALEAQIQRQGASA